MPKFLTEEQVEFYKENGYIKLENIFSKEEFDKFSDEYDDLFTSKHNPGMEAAWEGNDIKELANHKPITVLSIHNLQYHSATFLKVIMNDKLLDALEDIMGTPNVLLHHTKAHMKPPEKGAPYLMHQDYHYFPFKQHSMVAVFIHMDDTTPENGGLAIYPGSHKLGPLEDHGITKNGEAYHWVDKEKWPLSGATPVYAKRGDIVVFSYLLLHGSYTNASRDRYRRMFLIQLMSAEDEPTEDTHKSLGQGMVLRGRNAKRDATMATRFSH